MKSLLHILFLLLAYSNGIAQSPKYEFRGVWVATVENIDWPSKKGLTTQAQKEEFNRLLDMHRRNGMNAVVVQIRPVADAFFPSQYEPWSEYLTGKQGQPPSPYYDPLQFMIEETHKRGMEFHAWINPYRAKFSSHSSIAPAHITRIHPEWFVTYGDKKYFDPGLPQVRNYVNKIIEDVVQRYNIDAVHIDDYFYPYKIPGREFPDAKSYKEYGGKMERSEWRRSNVDSIILMLSKTIKQVNSRVKFGISPFGIWRNKKEDPKGSNTNGGSSYDENHADVMLWLSNEWIDYIAPQLYWNIGHKLADYKTLLDWWNENGYTSHLYIGHGFYRAGETGWKRADELPRMLTMLREKDHVHGSVYFSSKSFLKNPMGWNDSLRLNYYRKPALVAPMQWIDSVPPPKPVIEKNTIKLRDDVLEFKVSNNTADVRNYVIYLSDDNDIDMNNSAFIFKIVPAAEVNSTQFVLPDQTKKQNRYLKITAVDINNNESPAEDLLLMK